MQLKPGEHFEESKHRRKTPDRPAVRDSSKITIAVVGLILSVPPIFIWLLFVLSILTGSREISRSLVAINNLPIIVQMGIMLGLPAGTFVCGILSLAKGQNRTAGMMMLFLGLILIVLILLTASQTI